MNPRVRPYRQGQRRGYQTTPRALPSRIPRPANDNLPTPPRPANDNERRIRQAARAAARMLPRAVLRALPGIGAALLAWELYQLYRQLDPAHAPSVIPGNTWTREDACANPVNDEGSPHKVTGSSVNVCLQGQAVSTDRLWEDFPGNASPDWDYATHWMPQNWIGGSVRYQSLERWRRVTEQDEPKWYENPAQRPRPNLRPWNAPVRGPDIVMPLPHRALPHRRVDEESVPGERSERGYTVPAPGVRPRPQLRRYHPRKPGRGTKERKLRVQGGIGAAIWTLASTVTEAGDLIDALYDAIPAQYRRGSHRTVQDRAKVVYRHADKIDLEAAGWNILFNEIQDRLIGQANRGIDQRAIIGDRPIGVGTGPAL